MCPTLLQLDLLTYSTKEQGSWSTGLLSKVQPSYQPQPVAKETSFDSVSTKFTHSLSPPCSYLFNLAIVSSLRVLVMCCVVSGTHVSSHPLHWLPFSPFLTGSTDLPCIAVSWQCSGGFKPGNWVFVEESNTLTKTAHIFDCLPGVGVPIFLPQLLPLACDICYAIGYLIDHSGCESIWSYVKLYIQCS